MRKFKQCLYFNLKSEKKVFYLLTSSNFSAIIEKALKIASVGPVIVTILSGQEPSEILIRAPLCQKKNKYFSKLYFPGSKLSRIRYIVLEGIFGGI